MDVLINILITGFLSVFVIGLLVFIHEFGHFIVAVKYGVFVQEFAFGFGKRLFQKKINGTNFRINLFPFGGYVKMIGDLDGSSFMRYENKRISEEDKEFVEKLMKDENIDPFKTRYDLVEDFYYKQKKVLNTEDQKRLSNYFFKYLIPNHPGNFENIKYYQKILVLVAGVTMNMALAIILFFVYFLLNGFVTFLPKVGDPLFVGADVTKAPIFISYVETDNIPISIINKIDGVKVDDKQDVKELLASKSSANFELILFNGKSISINYEFDGKGIRSNFDQDFDNKLMIVVVSENSAATVVGLKAGDVIESINGVLLDGDIQKARDLLASNRGKQVNIKYYDAEGNQFSKSVSLPNVNDGEPVLGVNFINTNEIEKLYFQRDILKVDYSEYWYLSGFSHSFNMGLYNFTALGTIFGEAVEKKDITQVTNNVNSIFAVSDVFYSFVKLNNFTEIINISALVSLTLAVMNILPIPLLDGGNIVFITIEKIRKRKFSYKTQTIIGNVFFYLLVGMGILVIIKDFFQFNWISRVFELFKNLLGF